MQPRPDEAREAALRPLRGAGEQMAALWTGGMDDAGVRAAVLAIADAVERSLRRLLRGAEGAPLEVRLRALDAEETRPDEVLAELRRQDLLSVEAAAAVHELIEVRRRLGAGGAPAAGDGALALRAVERLESEIAAATALLPPPPEPDPLEDTPPHPVPPPGRRPRYAGALAALALIVLVVAGVLWFRGGDGDAELARGVTLFRSGAYEDAAAYFWRYAEAHPDDPTPHLYLARIHRRMQRVDLAVPELREALRLAPEDADVHSELGFLLLDQDRPDVAVERFRAALRLDPESTSAWVGLVQALRAAGRPAAAERVLARAPEAVRGLVERADRPTAPQP